MLSAAGNNIWATFTLKIAAANDINVYNLAALHFSSEEMKPFQRQGSPPKHKTSSPGIILQGQHYIVGCPRQLWHSAVEIWLVEHLVA